MKTENEEIADFMEVNFHQYNADGLLAGEKEIPKYDTSWDCLIPVVDRIAKMHSEKFHYDPIEMAKGIFPEDDNYLGVIVLPLSIPIKEAHKAVVEFIRWYNSQ